MKYSLALLLVLFGIWLLWSGHFDNSLLLGFGVASCLLVVFLSWRMQITDGEGVPLQLGLRPFTSYLPWLAKEIVVANIDVARRILHPKLPIAPKMIRVKATQRGDLGRVIYANSITLTPGTVSVDIAGDEIIVHALTAESSQLEADDRMDRRVTQLEGRG